jgi:hypothetical protein
MKSAKPSLLCKTLPQFLYVFRGKKTQQGYSKMEEIFHGERANFSTGEG